MEAYPYQLGEGFSHIVTWRKSRLSPMRSESGDPEYPLAISFIFKLLMEGWEWIRPCQLQKNPSSAVLRWTLLASSISLILQQENDHLLALSQWNISCRLILPQGNTLDWTMFVGQSQPSLDGWMNRWGQALEPGLVKKMEIYTTVLCRLKAQWMERTLE